MFVLVTGGAASGKSAYAENLLLRSPASPKWYLATMLAQDAESRARVERHRAMRKGKGFLTLEYPFALETLVVPKNSALLLECLSNLLANECFCPEGAGEHAQEAILRGIERLCSTAADIVVVSNEIFSDGTPYDPSTQAYIACLAHLNAILAQRADAAVEVVCGIPVVQKGRERLCT